ncbi:MAG TPA: hypothetical protein PLM85_09940, partial [Nitrosomonas sp.]|nr:hypothetical protein [Nitrosomonas sp.]
MTMTALQAMRNWRKITGEKYFPDITEKVRIETVFAIVFSMSMLLGNVSLQASEKITTSQDQKSITVTIYNENLALIKDSRNVELSQNINQLAWREVSALIRPETALLGNQTSQSGFHVFEQNFDFDLLTP